MGNGCGTQLLKQQSLHERFDDFADDNHSNLNPGNNEVAEKLNTSGKFLYQISELMKEINLDSSNPSLQRMGTALEQISSVLNFEIVSIALITGKSACYMFHVGEGAECLPMYHVQDHQKFQLISTNEISVIASNPQKNKDNLQLQHHKNYDQNNNCCGCERQISNSNLNSNSSSDLSLNQLVSAQQLKKKYDEDDDGGDFFLKSAEFDCDSFLNLNQLSQIESLLLSSSQHRNSKSRQNSNEQISVGIETEKQHLKSKHLNKNDFICGGNEWTQICEKYGMEKIVGIPIRKNGEGSCGVLILGSKDVQNSVFTHPQFEIGMDLLTTCLIETCSNLKDVVLSLQQLQNAKDVHQLVVALGDGLSNYLNLQDYVDCQIGLLSQSKTDLVVYFLGEQNSRRSSSIEGAHRCQSPVSPFKQKPSSTEDSNFENQKPPKLHRWSSIQIQTSGLSYSCLNMEDCILNHAITMQLNGQLPTLLYINNATNYLQRVATPAKDLYITSGPLNSLIIVPIRKGGEYIGGLYLTSTLEIDGVQIKSKLEGVVDVIGEVLSKKLEFGLSSDRDEIFKPVVPDSNSRSRSSSVFNSNRTNSTASLSYDNSGTCTQITMVPNLTQTLSLVASISNELRQNQEFSNIEIGNVEDVRLVNAIGQGGFGTVWKGVWYGQEVAVKVLDSLQSAVKKALEMAIVMTINHPNIVRAHVCFYDVILDKNNYKNQENYNQFQEIQLKNSYKSIVPQEQYLQTVNVMILEYCDKGTLHEAIQEGLVFGNPNNYLVKTSWQIRNILRTLLEIADALRYLHAHKIIHCDLKPSNILLQSNLSDERGFKIRLTDFGLAHLLSGENQTANTNTCGTFTHMAPEKMIIGNQINQQVDVYSFGVVMWEVWVGGTPYEDVASNVLDLISMIIDFEVRPNFGENVPQTFQNLAFQCWQKVPEQRPSFQEIMNQLENMLRYVDKYGYLV